MAPMLQRACVATSLLLSFHHLLLAQRSPEGTHEVVASFPSELRLDLHDVLLCDSILRSYSDFKPPSEWLSLRSVAL